MRLILVATIAALVACRGGERRPPAAGTVASDTTRSARRERGLTLPDGFTATIFADRIGLTRHLAAAPNGDLYANSWRSPYDSSRPVPEGGFLVALRDTNHDGTADVIRRFGPTGPGTAGGTGIGIHAGALYAEAGPAILRWQLPADGLAPTGAPDTVVKDMPVDGGHPMHPFVIDGEGNLFVDMGSATNACQRKDREPGSPGERPCRELAIRAGIWRFRADRTDQQHAPAARWATGIRNAERLAVQPGSGALYATQHGRDQLAENWPKLFDWKQSARLPAEELLRVQRVGDYGWPYCYYDPEQARLVLAPEYGGDGREVGECVGKLAPEAAYPAHWAPIALVFYQGSLFPERYRGGAFIAFHGSWNRAPEPQEGYNVVFQPFAQGRPTGDYQVFADGFAGKQKQPGTAEHRPAGLALGPDGALYVSDDNGGRIWRISYSAR